MLNKIMIVGEAFGQKERELGRPFVGASGWLLDQVLNHNGIRREDCYVTNVFNFQPAGNNIATLCGPKADAIPGLPKHSAGWIRAEFAPELRRLETEINGVRPNLILALGSTASWFLLSDPRITRIRGSTVSSRFGKVLPSYHPAAVLRDFSLRPILMADVEKAAREQEYPDVRRPVRKIFIEPSYGEILDFYRKYICPASALSVDVETIGRQITCIGLAPSASIALVIPFYDPSKRDGNYWPDLDSELRVWNFLRRLFREDRPLIGQNFIYDAKFLWASYGIRPLGMANGDDTMLLHHALQPELQKGLAFLGSIYTDEAPWKLERKNASLKKED